MQTKTIAVLKTIYRYKLKIVSMFSYPGNMCFSLRLMVALSAFFMATPESWR